MTGIKITLYKNMTVGISKFIQEHTHESIFNGDWEKLRQEVESILRTGKFEQGYRSGVILIPVDPKPFKCPVMKLNRKDRFVGQFDSRSGDEEPRKKLWKFVKELPPAKHVKVILYAKSVLDEAGDRATGADYDMIAIQALDVVGSAPMDPNTLIANHFMLDGGTSTKMSAAQFEKALKESVMYWKDRILCQP